MFRKVSLRAIDAMDPYRQLISPKISKRVKDNLLLDAYTIIIYSGP